MPAKPKYLYLAHASWWDYSPLGLQRPSLFDLPNELSTAGIWGKSGVAGSLDPLLVRHRELLTCWSKMMTLERRAVEMVTRAVMTFARVLDPSVVLSRHAEPSRDKSRVTRYEGNSQNESSTVDQSSWWSVCTLCASRPFSGCLTLNTHTVPQLPGMQAVRPAPTQMETSGSFSGARC